MNAIAQVSAPTVSGPKLDNRRVLAAVVDLVIVGIGGAVILAAGDSLSGDRQGALSAVVLGWALYYYFALESGGGQTLGKKLLKLRVVRADGRPAGMGEIAVRTILRVVDGIGVYIVGLIVMLVTGERRQRIGDLAASTIVVDASAPAATVAPPAVPDAEIEHVDEPEAEAAEEPADDVDADQPLEDEPMIEAAEPTRTITLPSRPAPPATLDDLATPSEEVPDEVEEPAVEPEPVVEAEEPVVEVEVEEPEPVVEVEGPEPVAEIEEPEQVVEVAEPSVEVEEPVVEVEEPELPRMMSPSLEGLAADVAATQESREDELAEEPDVEAEDLTHAVPIAEPVAEEEPEVVVEEPAVVVQEPAVAVEEPAEDGPVTVRSVETVSAMDLIMGAAEEDAGQQDPAESHEDEGPATA